LVLVGQTLKADPPLPTQTIPSVIEESELEKPEEENLEGMEVEPPIPGVFFDESSNDQESTLESLMLFDDEGPEKPDGEIADFEEKDLWTLETLDLTTPEPGFGFEQGGLDDSIPTSLESLF